MGNWVAPRSGDNHRIYRRDSITIQFRYCVIIRNWKGKLTVLFINLLFDSIPKPFTKDGKEDVLEVTKGI